LPIADNCPKGRIPSRNVTRDDLAIAVGKTTPALSRAAASDLVDASPIPRRVGETSPDADLGNAAE
jgi:hypothetical protein